MNILIEQPPNIEEITALWKIPDTAVFTWGNILYNPSNSKLPANLIAHEKTHTKQQGDNPEAWWAEYLKNDKFRAAMELQAYQKQFQFYCKHLGQFSILERQKMKVTFLHKIASQFSGPMYGNIIEYKTAVFMIGANI